MLRVAAERDPSIEWVRGDLRSPPVDGHFDLVSAVQHLQHLHSDEDLAQAFAAVRRLLARDGLYAFDVAQPNLDWLARPERDLLVREITDGEGRRLELREDRFYDPDSLILTTDWRLQEGGDGRPVARIGTSSGSSSARTSSGGSRRRDWPSVSAMETSTVRRLTPDPGGRCSCAAPTSPPPVGQRG